MARKKYLTIENESGEQGQIMPESREVWEDHGWTVLDDETEDEDADEAPVPVAGDSGGPVVYALGNPDTENEE